MSPSGAALDNDRRLLGVALGLVHFVHGHNHVFTPSAKELGGAVLHHGWTHATFLGPCYASPLDRQHLEWLASCKAYSYLRIYSDEM
jgi:hypothetical protein